MIPTDTPAEPDWQDGDLAMVVCSDGVERRATYYSGGYRLWRFADGTARSHGSSAASPLVVIDPEDAEQVERLNSAWMQAKSADLDDTPLSLGALRMRQALREFARPTPRIEEPLGLGAVVEDADGTLFVKWSTHHRADRNWKSHDNAGDYRAWADIDAVRILSPGVES